MQIWVFGQYLINANSSTIVISKGFVLPILPCLFFSAKYSPFAENASVSRHFCQLSVLVSYKIIADKGQGKINGNLSDVFVYLGLFSCIYFHFFPGNPCFDRADRGESNCWKWENLIWETKRLPAGPWSGVLPFTPLNWLSAINLAVYEEHLCYCSLGRRPRFDTRAEITRPSQES